jgi:hypothetical protein
MKHSVGKRRYVRPAKNFEKVLQNKGTVKVVSELKDNIYIHHRNLTFDIQTSPLRNRRDPNPKHNHFLNPHSTPLHHAFSVRRQETKNEPLPVQPPPMVYPPQTTVLLPRNHPRTCILGTIVPTQVDLGHETRMLKRRIGDFLKSSAALLDFSATVSRRTLGRN